MIPGVVRVAFDWVTPALTRHAANVMHFHSTDEDLASLITALDANVTANMWGHTRNDTGIVKYTLTPLDGLSGSVEHATSGTKWFGTLTGGIDIVPQASALIKLTTALRGRRFRGRVFLPWPAEVAVTSGTLNSSNQSTMQSAWNTFRSAMAAAGKDLLVASYKEPAGVNVTATTVESLLATQRRRQPRP